MNKFISNLLRCGGTAPAFEPAQAASCDHCDLATRHDGIFFRVADSGVTVCPICRLGLDPSVPDEAVVVLLLPELSQSELNVFFTALMLRLMRARKDRCSDIAVKRYHGLLESLHSRAQHTHLQLPFTSNITLLRSTLTAMPAAERDQAITALTGLRYLPASMPGHKFCKKFGAATLRLSDSAISLRDCSCEVENHVVLR